MIVKNILIHVIDLVQIYYPTLLSHVGEGEKVGRVDQPVSLIAYKTYIYQEDIIPRRGMSTCTSTSLRVFHGQSLFGRRGHEDSFCSLVNIILTCQSRLATKSLVFVIHLPSILINPYSLSS